MRRLLPLLLLGASAFAATAPVVQVCTANNVGGSAQTALTATCSQAIGAGHLVIMSVGYFGSTNAMTPSDSATDTFSAVLGPTAASSNVVQTWYIPYSKAGATTFSVSVAGSGDPFIDMIVVEYPFAGILDQSGASSGSNTGTITSSSLTTLSPAEILVNTDYHDGANSATVGSGYTFHGSVPGGLTYEDQMVSATGAYTATLTGLSNPSNYANNFATFRIFGSTKAASVY